MLLLDRNLPDNLCPEAPQRRFREMQSRLIAELVNEPLIRIPKTAAHLLLQRLPHLAVERFLLLRA
ncbi:hypothetical protein D3C75_1015380 [compost metagenome]